MVFRCKLTQAVLVPRGGHRAREEHHRGRGCERHEPVPQHQAVRGQVRPGDRGALQRRLLLRIVGKVKALAGVQYMLRSHRNTTHPVHDTVDQDT